MSEPSSQNERKRERGRPTRLDPDVHQRIVTLVHNGNYLETAAACAGVDSITLRRWIQRGEREAERLERGLLVRPKEAAFVAFARDIAAAMAEAEHRAVTSLVLGGKADWRAALAYLERKFPRKWGPRVSLTVKQELDAFLDTLQRELPSGIFAEVLRIAARGGDGEAAEGGSR